MLTGGLLKKRGYRMLGLLGQGGQSRVFLIEQENTGIRRVAKCLRPNAEEPAAAVHSLRTEADILRGLSHPCLPALIEIIEEGDIASPILILEYIEGKTLSALLKELGPQRPETVILWGIRLCEILKYLHTQTPPVIYRDLKPGNVILRPDGDLALIDFGSARRYKIPDGSNISIEDTVFLGTRGYAAPEQFGGHGQSDPRADLYGLGATLYHLLLGQHPAGPLDIPHALTLKKTGHISRLAAILSRCTDADPAGRPASAAELRETLLACMQQPTLFHLPQPFVTLSYHSRDRLIRPVSRQFFARAAACVLLCIPAVSLGVLARRQIADAMESEQNRQAYTAFTAADQAISSNTEEREAMSETEFYLELSRRIRDNEAALEDAGVSKEELQEILRYIYTELEAENARSAR